jgi:hypothetical protein
VTADTAKGGQFVWGQVIDGTQHGYFQDGKETICDALSGLDNAFPYNVHPGVHEVTDNPRISITGDISAWDSFLASMYVFWQPNTEHSIPVPLGNVFWGVDNMYAAYSGGAWQTPIYTLQDPIVFSPNTAYPLWFSVANNGSPCHAKG